MDWLKADVWGAGIIGGIFPLIVGVVFLKGGWLKTAPDIAGPIYAGLAIVYGIIVIAKPTRDAEFQRQYTDYFVTTTDSPVLDYKKWRESRGQVKSSSS